LSLRRSITDHPESGFGAGLRGESMQIISLSGESVGTYIGTSAP
jgi:hypothetical protein